MSDQRVVVDYSGPNIGKPFSVGHLRSTVIGQAVKNIYQAAGAYTIGVNHVGDFGTQFGKLILAVDRWGDLEQIGQDPARELQKLYVKFHDEAAINEQLNEEARSIFKLIEEGDQATVAKWQQIVQWSMPEYDKIYDLLNISFHDEAVPETGVMGESAYTKEDMSQVLKELREKKLTKLSEGAEILCLREHNLPETVLVRTDGASVYLLRDLAALKFRLTKWRADKIIYHIGVEQRLHLQQLFAAAVELGWLANDAEAQNRLVAALHGHYRLPEGKMSTRAGRGVLLEDLINEGVRLSSRLLAEKGSDLKNKNSIELATNIAVGAIKYNDLSHNREQDIIFDWGRALNLEGNSAPYLMYTHARIKGLERKAAALKINLTPTNYAIPLLQSKKEQELILAMQEVEAAFESAAKRAMPHLLAEAVYKLAQKFNTFYGSESILKNDDQSLVAARLVLTKAVGKMVARSLTVLGLVAPDRM